MRTLIVAAALVLAANVPAKAASFNCTSAKLPAEVLICQNDNLSAADEINASIYSQLRGWVPNKKVFNANERKWIKDRNACGYDLRCLKAQYENHIAYLCKLSDATEAKVEDCDQEPTEMLEKDE